MENIFHVFVCEKINILTFSLIRFKYVSKRILCALVLVSYDLISLFPFLLCMYYLRYRYLYILLSIK